MLAASSQKGSEPPSCKKCKEALDPRADVLRSSSHYFDHCATCRDDAAGRKIDGEDKSPASTSSVKGSRTTVGADGGSTASTVPLQVQPSLESRAAPASDVRECDICGDDVPLEQFISLTACRHPAQSCADCFAHWLNEQVKSNVWDRIRCPSQDCDVIISHSEIKEHATPEVYTRYDELAMRSALSTIKEFRHCLRPGCSSGQIHDSSNQSNIFICNACGFRVCTVHNEEFHTGETCVEHDQRLRNEQRAQRTQRADNEASLNLITSTTKRCPGPDCGASIAKDRGCDHMTCRRCKFEFCWLCMAPYHGVHGIRDVGNSAHATTCSWWKPNPVAGNRGNGVRMLNRAPAPGIADRTLARQVLHRTPGAQVPNRRLLQRDAEREPAAESANRGVGLQVLRDRRDAQSLNRRPDVQARNNNTVTQPRGRDVGARRGYPLPAPRPRSNFWPIVPDNGANFQHARRPLLRTSVRPVSPSRTPAPASAHAARKQPQHRSSFWLFMAFWISLLVFACLLRAYHMKA